MTFARWVMVAAMSMAAACGAPGATTIRVQTDVHIVRGDARERLGGAPEESRVLAAAAALEKALGHPVAIEVDAALTPETSAGVVVQTASSLEALARYFGREAEGDPALHAFVKEKLVRIVARYRASAQWGTAAFDDATGALVFETRDANLDGWLPDGYSIDEALEDGYGRYLAARFAKKAPSNVAERDLDAYFRYLRTGRGERSMKEPDEARAARLFAMLLFEAHVRSKDIHRDVERYLADQAAWMLDRKMQVPAGSSLRAAYAHWVDERFFATSHETRSKLYDRFFRSAECPADPCPLLPEVDRVRLALGFFERTVPADEKDFDAFDQALCLYEEKGAAIVRNRSCASVYVFLTENDARSERLVAALVRAQRRDLLVAALANAGRQMPVFLVSLEKTGGPLYPDALRILSDVDYYGFRDQTYALRAEVTRTWPRRVDLRPLLLRLVVEDYLRTGRDDEAFSKLAGEFAPIDAVLFARFLDDGPRSVELSPSLWPALGQVTTPFEIVAPRLASYVATRGPSASKTVTALVRRACEKKDLEGLRVLRVVLQNHAKTGDKDAVALALAARDCKTNRP